jgi:hypothetical protein
MRLYLSANWLELDLFPWHKLLGGCFCNGRINSESRQQVCLLMGVGQIEHILHCIQLAQGNRAIDAHTGILCRRFGERAKSKAGATDDQKFLEHLRSPSTNAAARPS